MIKLVASLPAWGMPDISPFSNKVEAYLRIAKIPFQMVAQCDSGLAKLPKGKLPVIIDGDEVVADSAIIYKYLDRHFDDPLGKWLTPRDRSLATVIGRMMDESFYWYIAQIRYRRPENYWTHYAPILSRMVRDMNPEISAPEIQQFVEDIRTLVLDQFQASGRGRHSEAEVEQFAAEELAALATILSDKSYFFGDRPSFLDAHVFAFLACVSNAPFDSPIRDRLCDDQVLSRFIRRIEAEFYPERI